MSVVAVQAAATVHGVTSSTARPDRRRTAAGDTVGAKVLAVAAAAMIPLFAACSDRSADLADPEQSPAPTAERRARAVLPGVRRRQRPDDGRADPGHRPGQHRAQLGGLPVAAGRRHPRPALLVHLVPGQPDRPGTQDRGTVAHQRGGRQHRGPRRLHRDRRGPDRGGDNLCEIGIQFDDDFIEWSISFAQKPFPDPCEVAKELTRQSIVNSK